MYRLYPIYILYVFLFLSLTSCANKLNTIDPNIKHNDQFVIYALKAINSIDIAADTTYKIFGDLYKQDKISEEDKNKLIEIGLGIKSGLDLSKEALGSYMVSLQLNENISSSKDKTINCLIILSKTFYQFKDQAQILYKSITGNDLIIPDIFLFDIITNSLIKDE